MLSEMKSRVPMRASQVLETHLNQIRFWGASVRVYLPPIPQADKRLTLLL